MSYDYVKEYYARKSTFDRYDGSNGLHFLYVCLTDRTLSDRLCPYRSRYVGPYKLYVITHHRIEITQMLDKRSYFI